MNSKSAVMNFAGKILYYFAVIMMASIFGSFGLWHSSNCWAGQTVNVNVGDNLQALVNQYPASTTFSLAPGIHRLQSVVPKYQDSFVGQTGAIISGAALLTAFSQNGSHWISHVQATKAASYPGQCDSKHPACIFPEDLFFDNVLKTRVASLASVVPGSWYLDYSTGNVYMGDNPSGHTVEISLLGYAFSGGASSVTISNLIIEKYACVAGNGAVNGAAGSMYWAVERNEIRYNHGRGITTGNGMYIDANKIHHNGQLGMGGGGANICIQSNEISYNNTSGYSLYWEAGGAKFANVQYLTIEYNYAHNNAGPGFWNDINSEYVTYNSNQAAGNIEAGILSEISNNITISNNYIWDDGYNTDGPSIWYGAGILISNSSNVSIYSNVVSNCMNGIGGILQNRGTAPNGQPYSLQNVDVTSNTITQGTGMAAGIVVGTGFNNSVYTSWNNQFQPNTFKLANPGGYYFYWLGQSMTLTSWLTALAAL